MVSVERVAERVQASLGILEKFVHSFPAVLVGMTRQTVAESASLPLGRDVLHDVTMHGTGMP